MKLSTLLADWLTHVWASHPPENTFRAYSSAVDALSHNFGKARVEDLTQPRVQQMVNKLRGAPATVRLRHSVLAMALDFAIASRLVPGPNPARGVKLPKIQKTGVKRLDDTDVAIILHHCTLDPVMGPAVKLLLVTGIRRAEACSLKWEDWDWTRGGFHVRKSKSAASERFITVPATVLAEFQTLSQNKLPGSYVFPAGHGGRTNPDLFGRNVAKLVQRAGVAGHWTTHTTRHTHASMLVEKGRSLPDIARRLGHSSPRITMDIYAHPAAKGDAALAADMESIL